MDGFLERALLLLSQSRPRDAEEYARKSIEDEGESPEAFQIITQALIQQEKAKDAVKSGKEALRLAPDDHWSHFLMGWAFMADRQFKKAEKHLLQSREIYPEDADTWGFLALLECRKSKWDNALELAEKGLSFDAENTNCVNARARALLRLKRGSEASDTLDSALGRDPENARLHYHKGYTLLEKGDFHASIESLGEALRLDPSMEEAKEGLVEALKGRYKIYAVFLKYIFFMSRLTSGQRYGVFIGGYITQRVASQALTSAGYPLLGGMITGLYLLLILFTWGASSFFNALLFMHPIGRHALDRKEKRISIAVICNVATALAVIAAGMFLGSLSLAAPSLGFMGCIIPYSSLNSYQTKWKILVVCLFAGFVNLVSLSAVYLAFMGQNEQALNLSLFSFIACMLYSWVPGFLSDQ